MTGARWEEGVESLANDIAGLVADDVHQAIFTSIRTLLATSAGRSQLQAVIDSAPQ